jgi:nitronate monooxygenase
LNVPTAAVRRFCERLGLEVPIVLAPMGGGPSTPALVAAVASGGGLGVVAAGYLDPDGLARTLQEVRLLTDGPIGINIFVPPAEPPTPTISGGARSALQAVADELGITAALDFAPVVADHFDDHVRAALAADAGFVSFAFGVPPREAIEELQRAGRVVAATANTLAEALELDAAGCDAVVLQGFEAGAHRGGLTPGGDHGVGLIALMEECRGALRADAIASGGVTSGAGVAACLALGAAAVQVGTAFLVSDESGATDEWKKEVAAARDTDIVVTRTFSGKSARGIRNDFVTSLTPHEDDLPGYPIQNAITGPIRAAARSAADARFQSLWVGQAAAATRPGPAAKILARMRTELADTLADLTGAE